MGVAIRSSQCMIMSMPLTQSSMYMKLRVWSPSPQMSMRMSPVSLASITLRQMAAGAFSRPPSQVPMRTVDVVEAGDGGLQPRSAQYSWQNISRHQLLPAVAALGHGRVGIGFLERADVGVLLQVGVVGAGRRGEEVALGAGPVGGLDHVGVDEDAAQALDAEVLDEAHAAHVGRQVVDLHRALARPRWQLASSLRSRQRLSTPGTR